ncbi:MAG: tRNA (adenosine(37)-N6)-threonylcarbamoyltransferase complex ATPase subunit type 1 TsaE [Flavobacterium sp.]|nr:tRNA (adenosine(37)-N6)-threonylcarbamoyltransferase complex ATPase subunit type 1 TsaE [Pedobacter sp.]
MDINIKTLSDLPGTAAAILQKFPKDRVFMFFAEMSAGKTTFIKAICAELGVMDLVSSPTYSIVNEYNSAKEIIYHFDFYRIKSESEAFDIGFEEYIFSGNYCLIEWPEKIKNLWPPHYLKIEIQIVSEAERLITVTPE